MRRPCPAFELPLVGCAGLETVAHASSFAGKECRLMQMLYNSDHYVVVEFDMGTDESNGGDGAGG
jgi:hypothetical protein